MSFDWRRECAVVIPCLNEAAGVGVLVQSAKKFVEMVIVVDDGSSDGTAQTSQNAGASVIRFEQTQGKGAALRAGWNNARKNGCRWAICLDGDGQHDPSCIPAFFEKAEAACASLVIGNRMGDARKIPLTRRLVNRSMSGLLSYRTGQVLPDSQCGFRLMDLVAYEKLQVETAHFEIESEILVAFIRAKLKIAFVPRPVIYAGEVSKINPITDTVRWLRWWRGKASKS
jgi:glycosyltransferase involved in cell wall biosynthesis